MHTETDASSADLPDDAPLRYLARRAAPDETFAILGAAYWDSLKTAAGTAFAKLIFGALLGPLGWQASGKEHRAGVIGVTDRELFVIDLGTVVGEDITHKALRSAIGSPSVRTAPLSELTATWHEEAGSAVLSVEGALKLKATFPDSYRTGNLAKAAEIAAAIQAARN